MSFDWKTLVKNIAPVLGTALGGPFGGVATKIIADKLLGNPDADEQDIAQALQNPTPDQILKIKESEQQFILESKKIDLDYYKTDASDRADARAANNQNNKLSDELIKGYLVLTLSAILFFCLYALIKQDIQGVEANIISAILGADLTALLSMVNFYWGTSKSSAMKDDFIMNNKNK